MSCLRLSHRLVLTCVTAALALPASALATHYCVPTVAACPGGTGTAAADLPTALTAAAAATDSDAIYLASGTFTAPTTAGFNYNANTSPVQVIGAGSTGAGRTTLTTPSAATQVLHLLAGPASGISHLQIRVADSPPAVPLSHQLEVRNTAVSDVVIDSTATQANAYIALQMDGVSSLDTSTISVNQNLGGNAHAVFFNGTGNTVTTSTLSAPVGVGSNASGVSATVSRVTVTSANLGIDATGMTIDVSHSLITLSASACGLYALDQPASDGVINADGVTIVGSSNAQRAACASTIFSAPRSSTVNVTNSILRPYGRSVFSSGTAAAAINVTYSDFDPSQDTSAGSSSTLSPAMGQLGATNINADPLFLGASDFHLGTTSPALDVGDPSTAAGTDLDGNPLLYDGNGDCTARRDIGAYERQSGAQPCPVPPDPPNQDPPAGPGDNGTPQNTPPAASGPTVRCVVPKLRGLTKAKAAKRLKAAHCALGKVKRPGHAHGRLIVARQGASAGTALAAGSRVAVALRVAPVRPRHGRAGPRG